MEKLEKLEKLENVKNVKNVKNAQDGSPRTRSEELRTQPNKVFGSVLLVGIVAMLAMLFLPSSAIAGRLDPAQKRANEFFKGRSFTALVDLETAAKYDVDADGRPTTDKVQGRHRRDRGIISRNVAFAAGTGGRGIFIGVDESDNEIKVTLAPKRGLSRYVVSIYIHFDRPLTETDVDPRAIARALAAYAEFEGVIVGEEIGAALEALDDQDASGGGVEDVTSAQAVPTSGPTIVSMAAVATPTSPRRGEDILLQLTFDVAAPAGESIEVVEQRNLSFGGVPLPGYPVVTKEARAAGTYTTSFRQPIPGSAAAGSYEYRSEVCVAGDCISRSVVIEIDE